MEWLKVWHYEGKIIHQFDKNLLITTMEQKANSRLRKAGNIAIVGNGVDPVFFQPPCPYNRRKIVFLGNFHSFPNRDGVIYFYRRILPLIKQQVPDIKFVVLGANPSKEIIRLTRDKNVMVTSEVQDVREYLADAGVLVCPLRIGTGIQNKIIEAMAMNIPVITTSAGASWLLGQDKQLVTIADRPSDFAREVINLLSDDKRRTYIIRRARAFVRKKFLWDLEMSRLENILENICLQGK
jgi:glycosyltransferase involved in cell wall biosynthesis